MNLECLEFHDLATDYLERALSPCSAHALERHLEKCFECEALLDQLRLTIAALGSLRRERVSDPVPASLLQTFRGQTSASNNKDTGHPESLLEDLLRLPPSERKPAFELTSGSELSEVGSVANERALQMAVEKPETGLRISEVAVEVFDHLSRLDLLDRETANNKLGEALAIRGNCKRICSDFMGARADLLRAGKILDSGAGNRGQKARVLQMTAQLRADQGQLNEALADLDLALSIYREMDDTHNEGRTLIGKGRVLGFSGLVEDAIPCLEQGLELIDQDRDLRLVLVAKHNLVEYLSDSDSGEGIQHLLLEVRELHELLSNSVDQVRFKWLEGKIALEQNDLTAAERLLLEVKTYFVENEMSHDVAVASLYLAMIYLKQARTAELKELAGEMVTIFSGLGIRREVIAALAFFSKAQEIEQTATLGVIQELIEILDKTRRRGDLRPRLNMSNPV